MTFTTPQVAYPIALGVGRFVRSGYDLQTIAGLRSTVGTTRQITIDVGSCTSGVAYSIRGRRRGEEWVTASFTTAATTDTLFRNGLVAAWNAQPVLAGLAEASNAGSGVKIQLDALTAGDAGFFEVEIVANPASALSALTVVVAGADAVETPFGRYVELGAIARSGNLDRTQYAHLSALAGPVLTFAATYAGSETGQWSAILQSPDGDVASYGDTGIATGGNLAAFLTAINASLTAAFSGTGAVIATSSPNVTVSLPIGWSVVTLDASASGSADIVATNTDGSSVPASAIVYDDRGQAPTSIGGDVTGYAAGKAAGLLVKGALISVENPGASVSTGGAVWIETAAGANLGRPYASASPTRFMHPVHKWVQIDTVSPSLAVIAA